MNLYDKLSTEDKQLITDYLMTYTHADSIPDLSLSLREWVKNKKTLYRALGNQFRITIPIEARSDNAKLFFKLTEKYDIPTHYYSYYVPTRNTNKENRHVFINSLLNYFDQLSEKETFFSESLYEISRNLETIINWQNLFKGHISYFPYSEITYNNKTLKFNQGVKPLRILRKVLNLIDFPHMDTFEMFCNDVSYELTNKNNTMTNLVLSIHPIDFMTMSHNTCNWSSCMDWENGCYSNGVLEMMNSNMTVVAYIESSSQDFVVNGRDIPNKSWRCLYYLHKQIICSGKAYPYNNDVLVRKGLDALANLVKKNLSWKYQYKNQRYFDMCNFGTNEDARNYIVRTEPSKHNIILYNYAAMYNDFANDHEEHYYCYRNWVPRTLMLCTSGTPTCIFCGQPLTSAEEINKRFDYYDSDFFSRGNSKCCESCQNKYYNYQTKKFYLTTPQYDCKVLNFRNNYSYSDKSYTIHIYSTTITLTTSDTHNLIMPSCSMPKKAYELLNSISNCKISENSVFIVETWAKETFYNIFVSHNICNSIEEAQTFFSPVPSEIIASYPQHHIKE